MKHRYKYFIEINPPIHSQKVIITATATTIETKCWFCLGKMKYIREIDFYVKL